MTRLLRKFYDAYIIYSSKCFYLYIYKTKDMKLIIYIFCMLFITLNASATQLSGTYSINPSASATTTNFQNFSSAITYLTGSGTRSDGGPSNSSPFGVSSSVTFFVAAGTYTGQVNLAVTIPGISLINTVTFDGGNGNASTRIITYAGINSGSGYPTIAMFGISYITFRNLTINNTSSNNSECVLISLSNNCRISNCILNQPSPTGSNFCGIMFGGIFNGPITASYRADSVLIDSNIFNTTGGSTFLE